MKNGHHSGYRMRAVGESIMYYCPRHPGLLFRTLRQYDLHYEVEHRALVLDGFDTIGRRARRA